MYDRTVRAKVKRSNMLSVFWREVSGNRLDTLMEDYYGIGGVGMVSGMY